MSNEVYKVSETWGKGVAMRGVPLEDVLKIAAAYQEERLIILPIKEGTPCYRRYMDCDSYVPGNCDDHENGCEECGHRHPVAIAHLFKIEDVHDWGVMVFETAQEAEAEQALPLEGTVEGYADQSGLAPAT